MKEKSFEEQYNFYWNTSNALLLQFKNPVIYDLSIPDPYEVGYLIAISNRIMNGEEINPESVTCVTSNPKYNHKQYLKKDSLSKVSPRVSEGLLGILKDSREEYSFLCDYMLSNPQLFSNNFFHGKGTWFRFRDGMREQTEKEVMEYFNQEEFSDFEKIGNLFQPYIERVGASHPCKS
jgi:hypothetical protein